MTAFKIVGSGPAATLCNMEASVNRRLMGDVGSLAASGVLASPRGGQQPHLHAPLQKNSITPSRVLGAPRHSHLNSSLFYALGWSFIAAHIVAAHARPNKPSAMSAAPDTDISNSGLYQSLDKSRRKIRLLEFQTELNGAQINCRLRTVELSESLSTSLCRTSGGMHPIRKTSWSTARH